MEIENIYKKFDEIGSVVFATVDGDFPETRIAHFFAYDDKGLYFRTMNTKPFYHQLKMNKTVSVCGLNANPFVNHDDEGMPLFEPGYSIRVTGTCEEVDIDYVKEKAVSNKDFEMGYKDVLKYPATKIFVLNSFRGEIFDYDFELVSRDHKLKRTRFSINGASYPDRGLKINNQCVNCKKCLKACSFNAISMGDKHMEIDPLKCDACGDCTLVCNFDAIDVFVK